MLYCPIISNTTDELFLKCTTCEKTFSALLNIAPADFDEVEVEDKTYKCSVCTRFDTYAKADLFYLAN